MNNMNKKKITDGLPLPKFILWLFNFLGLISVLLIFIFFFMVKISFGFLSLQPYWLLPLLLMLVFGIVLLIYALIILTKQLGTKKTDQTKNTKVLLIFTSIISFIALAFFINIAWSLFNEKPPQFFPFNDPDATYTITKHGNNFMLKYESTGDLNSHQVCDLENGKTKCRTEINRNIEVMIGKSEDELEPLLGKQVTVNGDFVYSDQQCIAEQCHHIGGWAVLNIERIEEIAN